MKASQLRIGNLINGVNYKPYVVTSITAELVDSIGYEVLQVVHFYPLMEF